VKNALGKLLLLLLFSLVNAKDFDYTIQVNTKEPYVKEAVILHFDVNQTNHDIVLLFDFDILKSPNYEAQRINIQEEDKYHNVSIRYSYLIYALHAGDINIAFRLTQKATTDDSVAYSFSGDRDNVKTLETKDSDIKVKALTLKVKAIPKNTDIVGDFTLDYQIPKHKAKAYEPLPLHIQIKGIGYPPIIDNILAQKTAFNQFSQTPIHTSINNQKGTENLVKYTMALSHDKHFSLNALDINAFNPLLQKSYILTLPRQDFRIEESNQSQLLDSIDSPPPLQMNWENIQMILSYLMVFTLGYTLALFKRKKLSISKKSLDKASLLKIKILHTSSHKSLLQLLIAQNTYDFSSTIEKLERVCYQNENIALKTLKKEAQENIHA